MNKASCISISFLFTLTFLPYGKIFSQEVSMPSGFQQHGNNSSGITVVTENTDSVTVGAIMQYWVQPDTSIAGSSTFSWTIDPALGSQTAGDSSNLATVTFVNTPATGTIKAHEISPAPASCAGADNTPTDVEVIDKPTVQFTITSSSYCGAGSDGSQNYTLSNLPISWTSSVSGYRNLKVNISVTCTNSSFLPATQTADSILVTETGPGTATFDIPIVFDYYGIYTITLTAIIDRISEKCAINGSVGASSSYSFLLSPTPISIPLKHVTNQ